MTQNNHPFRALAGTRIREGHTIHQKFTCANCGARQTMEEPNIFYKLGNCEECGHTTNIERDGCNYLLIIGLKEPTQ